MAAAKIKRKKKISTDRTEFFVPLDRVLSELLDSDQVQVTDRWQFVDNGHGLTICRDRITTQDYDDNGNPI